MISFKATQTGTLLLLLIGLSFTVTSAFAFWRDVTVTNEVEVATIGNPVEIIIDNLSDTNSEIRLVPIGFAISVGDVERIELRYNIGVSRELLNEVILSISVNDILIDGDDTYSHLVKISVMGEEGGVDLNLFNDTVTITIVVELLEPIDLEEATSEELDLSLVNVENAITAYEEINGKDISCVLEFELIKKEIT